MSGLRVILNGAAGRMGQEVAKKAEAGAFGIVARVDRLGSAAGCLASLEEFRGEADVIIDFSFHTGVGELLAYAVRRNLPVMIATTGHTEEELEAIRAASEKIPVFHSANMSIGVALLCELAKKTAAAMPDADIEIVETHHNRKADAPSGTALMLARAMQTVREASRIITGRSGKRTPEEIGIASVRRGNIVGIHEILISTDNETLTLKHEAHSRALFADGATAAAAFLAGKPAGLYDMHDMVKGSASGGRACTERN